MDSAAGAPSGGASRAGACRPVRRAATVRASHGNANAAADGRPRPTIRISSVRRAKRPRTTPPTTCSECGVALDAADAGTPCPADTPTSAGGSPAATPLAGRAVKRRRSAAHQAGMCDGCDEVTPRRRLDAVSTIDDAVAAIRKAKRVLVLCGAGISVSCGLPGATRGVESRVVGL